MLKMLYRYCFWSSIFILAFFIKTCSSIRCYECNSANNSMCLEPASYDAESVEKYLHTTNCERSKLLAQDADKQNLFCRKIVQTILHKGHDPEVRVTRGCGWVKHRKDCYKADNEDHLETVCQCFSDDCNAGTSLICNTLTLTVLIALSLRIFI